MGIRHAASVLVALLGVVGVSAYSGASNRRRQSRARRSCRHIDVDILPRRTVTIQIRIGSTPAVYFCRYHRALGLIGVPIPAPG